MKKTYFGIIVIVAIIFSLIGYTIKAKSINDSTENNVSEENGNLENNKPDDVQVYKRDLNNDGIEETIKITFQYEKDGIQNQKYLISIISSDKEYTFEEKDVIGIVPKVSFSDFNIKDKYIEFYINSEGQSDDPSSAIFRFDGNEIKKIYDTVGYIEKYDGEGKIYTDYSRTNDKFSVLLSYYDIVTGKVVYNDKNNLVGKTLQYDNSLILFSDSPNVDGAFESYVDDSIGKEEIQKIISKFKKEDIVKVCNPNEILTIVDIDNTNYGMFKEGNPRNIRIKVKTSEGKEGWLHWLNGGD